MAYNKKTDYWKWKADCLIGGFKRRHKKHDKPYTFLTKRADYAEILKTKMTNCEYCGVKLNRTNFSVDHKIPLAHGGDTSTENLAYCCSKCNTAKGEMNYDEFMALIAMIREWDDKGKYILSRLRAAGLMFKGRRF